MTAPTPFVLAASRAPAAVTWANATGCALPALVAVAAVSADAACAALSASVAW